MNKAVLQIAILGSTSEIAKDLILCFAVHELFEVTLFARRVELVHSWLISLELATRFNVKQLDEFDNEQRFDVVINFIGVGNPAQAISMGASILDVTLKYDMMALNYLNKYPHCKYIFLSSGAAYGGNFNAPVSETTQALVPINSFKPQDWYGMAKLYAECRHRSLPHLSIFDIRVFNYFSHTQNMGARFFITDIARSISQKEILITTPSLMVRDYIHPSDFFQLIHKLIYAKNENCSLDCYSRAPVDKLLLLETIKEKFGLRYEMGTIEAAKNATGQKPYYYSTNKKAQSFGYSPKYDSIQGICKELDLYIKK